ncbi:MAG TPA: hypothetical protein VNO31_34765 [Umezawaea sp.]|nr:hypothetical protein [Umezawaea sp.]
MGYELPHLADSEPAFGPAQPVPAPRKHWYRNEIYRMDYEICLDRHENRAAFPRAAKDRARGWGYQNRITDPAGFREWFYRDSCGGGAIRPEEIPYRWRGVV